MNNDDLGKLIEGEGHRDAIHVAIAPVTAGEKLYPGQHIDVGGEGKRAYKSGEPIGIVDPFLKEPVYDGEQFYILLYPNTITSLRHHWVHPSFGAESESKVESESNAGHVQWLKDFSEEIGIDYDTLLVVAEEWVRDGESYCFPHTTPPECWAKAEEMWVHLRHVADFPIPPGESDSPFRCAC